MQLARAAIAHRVRRRHRADDAVPLYRHYLTWTSAGYAVGAVHGWVTRVASRGRPGSYDDQVGRP